MATSFDRTKPLAGLPPSHVIDGSYTPTIQDKITMEDALSSIKNVFEENLKANINLVRVSAPMFVNKTSGFNDNLNGIERPASFQPRDYPGTTLEVPFSLAKWKRWALHYYGLPVGKGLVTDFRGLRCDDDVDFTHSLYVDQFDWEKVISPDERNVETLKSNVRGIYKAIYDTEQYVCKKYNIDPILPQEITFVSSDEMIKLHPHATPKERENMACEKYGAVFFMGIGGLNAAGTLRHDGRAPDYDDWITKRPDGGHGLNGDILVWNPLLQMSFELSSMGIRVNQETMTQQLELCECPERAEMAWHQLLLNGTLPQSIGGGVGQSRLCQFMLRCAHIGECQYGFYNPKEVEVLKKANVHLLGRGYSGEFDHPNEPVGEQ